MCNEEKDLTEYYTQQKHSKIRGEYTYYLPRCKECAIEYSMNWMYANYDRFKENVKKYDQTEKGRLNISRKAEKYRSNGGLQKWQRNNKDKLRKYRLYREMHKAHEITLSEWEDCKKYFNHRCAYCNLKIEEHYVKNRLGNMILGDFHRDHVDHEGTDDLSNCVPSCKSCNGSKWTFELNEWYSTSNSIFSEERLEKINCWLKDDYKDFLVVQ